jgi:hypothetical protein
MTTASESAGRQIQNDIIYVQVAIFVSSLGTHIQTLMLVQPNVGQKLY